MENLKTELEVTVADEKTMTVELALTEKMLEDVLTNAEQVAKLQKQEKTVREKLEVIDELQTLISGGKLLEYVSEEYMHLITDFSNKFVKASGIAESSRHSIISSPDFRTYLPSLSQYAVIFLPS